MATPILGGTAFDFGVAAQDPTQPQNVTAPAPSVQQAINLESAADTVSLSDGAQIRLLRTQGQTVPQIAANTALSTQAVNSYLGIAETTSPQK
jgi:hypothetical protein